MYRFFFAVGVVGLAGLRLSGNIPDGFLQDAVVDVDVRCRGDNDPTWDVDPDPVTITQGQAITWRLNANGHGNTVTVTPKEVEGQRPWPFENNSHAGNRANAARSGPSRANGRWQYDITVVCQQGNNEPRTVVIDPDIIITPGTP